MRKCVLNDCTGFDTVAPCCLDCPDHDICPDRCSRSDATFCVGVLDGGKHESVPDTETVE